MKESISQDHDEITVASFQRWLDTARAGAHFIYYRGFLAADRETVTLLPGYGSYMHVFYEPMHTLGQMAWHAYEKGRVTLVQRKLRPEQYEYIAFKLKQR
jgi:hypothetical protein